MGRLKVKNCRFLIGKKIQYVLELTKYSSDAVSFLSFFRAILNLSQLFVLTMQPIIFPNQRNGNIYYHVETEGTILKNTPKSLINEQDGKSTLLAVLASREEFSLYYIEISEQGRYIKFFKSSNLQYSNYFPTKSLNLAIELFFRRILHSTLNFLFQSR